MGLVLKKKSYLARHPCTVVIPRFHQLRLDLSALLTVMLLFLHSGPSWLAEVALQHQPPAAEPAPADEGGGRRGCQGQRGWWGAAQLC